ncbi:Disease resistance protein [Musa troglodytarum]|uniref:Disease resistance protein n=1 Tax=Musa troglodytarum TaxID=320322 RepID=A0A9E7J979_9LILI|nr:Disease resistance protein [Musa troglodytarum]
MLRRAIEGKSVFLVLDDVWRANVWVNLFRTPLSSAMAIRRILITTRDRKIANQMGVVQIHNVNLLCEDGGWELLCRSASLQWKKDIRDLRDIGIRIVRKCHDLPLAIKTMGGVLMTKEKRRGEWEKVLDNGAWTINKLPKELEGALYLSYEDLPSHLK